MSERKACRICTRMLSLLTRPDGSEEWWHFGDTDHDPVPVSPDEIQVSMVCDFCSAEKPDYVLPMEDFLYQNIQGPLGSGSRGNWAVCGGCAPLIDADDWRGLMRRMLGSWETKYGYPVPTELRPELWAGLREAREHKIGRLQVRDWSN